MLGSNTYLHHFEMIFEMHHLKGEWMFGDVATKSLDSRRLRDLMPIHCPSSGALKVKLCLRYV